MAQKFKKSQYNSYTYRPHVLLRHIENENVWKEKEEKETQTVAWSAKLHLRSKSNFSLFWQVSARNMSILSPGQ